MKIKPSEIKGWLESVQDEEDLENSTVDKIRRVMHLVYSMAQANDLIPRTAEVNQSRMFTSQQPPGTKPFS